MPSDSPRRLCFGGSFNPIHHGHLICARAVAEAAEFERVVFIPSAQPPHKPGATDLAPAEDRLRMCEIAVKPEAGLFEMDELELHRPGPSYTIATARALKQERGWDEVCWLIGADMLRYLPQWHEPLALLEEVTFLIMARPGWSFDWETMPKAYQKLSRNIVTAPLVDISATDIRRRVVAGRSIHFLTPEGVVDYIVEKGLYR